MGIFGNKSKSAAGGSGKGKRKKYGHWVKKEHLFGDVTYECSVCGSRCSHSEPVCPHCRAEMRKTKRDPVWVDEMEFYD